MKSSSFSRRVATWIPALALACSLGTSSRAQAETPVLIWGFQRGCDRMADIDQSIERDLYSQKRDVALLHTPDGKPLPPCSGERCAQAFRAACPNAKGRLLGGQGIQGKVTRTRLWLYDLATGQIAYQDEYCHTCNVIGALADHSRSLIEHPRFGPAPGSAPTYCSPSTSPARSEAIARGPVLLSVHGEGKHKGGLVAALRGQLEALGRTTLPSENRSYSREELDRLLAGQPGAKALLVVVQKENITVQLYDQQARVSDAEEVSCAQCPTETLVTKVKDAVSELLDRCAGTQCAEAARSGTVQAPVAACEAFPVDSCPNAALDALAGSGTAVVSSSGLDPKTARLVKGLTWGGFAASAATGITLLALSGTSAGHYRNAQGFVTSHNLDGPGWTGLGIAGVLLGISIPVTLVMDRAVSRGTQPTSASSGPAFIQCPN